MKIILIDFENVQPKDLAGLRGGSFQIRVFYGAHQNKVSFDLAHQLQPFGENANYIQIHGTGRNALDFHIAYYIGVLSKEFPDATFYIISKDKGFEPLIKHLKSQNTTCHLRSSLAGLAASPTPEAKPAAATGTSTAAAADRIQKVVDGLLARKEGRPLKLKALTTYIKGQLNKHSTERAIADVIARLKQAGTSVGPDGKLTWPSI